MNVVSAIVLLAIVWFMTLFVLLPVGLRTQGDEGETLKGTHAGSPAASFSMRRKLRQVTLVALPVWALICAVIIWGGITVADIDIFDRLGSQGN